MSEAARALRPQPDRPRAAPPTERVASPARPPAARPRSSILPQPSRRARRGPLPAFWVFSGVVVAAMVVAAVSLSASIVSTSFRVQELQGRIADLSQRSQVLTSEAASLSSPSRIAMWARKHGMVVPEDVVVLPVGGLAASARDQRVAGR